MDWKYKLYINGVYWKGYGGNPTQKQIEIETQSFKRTNYFDGGMVKIKIIK